MSYLIDLLNKIDWKITNQANSRPEKQVSLILDRIKQQSKKSKFILDIGGGKDARYKPKLQSLANKYLNLEVCKGSNVDIIGSIYKIPLRDNSVDIITLFMVLEHLSEPSKGLAECARVLKTRGYLALTTVQYWHTHNHPNDYYRYTREGLKYLCKKTNLKVISIWSMGGPFLVIYHAIELNLPGFSRTIFSIFVYRLFDWLDWVFYRHEDKREHPDSVGWSLIAQKVC